MNVLEVKDLKKKLGKREIIKGVTFSVKEGEVFGFLGPNGAGKTTTIRMLVGLIKPNEGSIHICNYNLEKDPINALANVGAVVENPELYGYLSGRENLMQIARIRKVPIEEVEKIIKLVGLEKRINDKFKKYSLGMKQRLGLAAALLSNPKLLILDEPTNGLDPSGILDFRDVVKKAAKERGMAVFVSSHILAEVQNLCDRVAFIKDGTIKSVEDIVNNSMETEKDVLTLVVNDENLALKVIEGLNYIEGVKKTDKGMEIVLNGDTSWMLVKELVKEDIKVKEIYKERRGLEQRYMELVEGGVR